MADPRRIWKPAFVYWPTLPCPSCRTGTLRADGKTISKIEMKSSIRAKRHEDWSPDWIEKRFNAILVCTNPICEDSVFVCGQITTDEEYDYDAKGEAVSELIEYYVPKFFEPAPPLFAIPDQCPKKVTDELNKAFALIWSDVGSCANRLRVAVEVLMNESKIQKRAKKKVGTNKAKLQILSLHERIMKFEVKHEEAAKHLMAIKWLGNTGSHAALDELNHDDLLGAFEHFDYALDLIYVQKGFTLTKRAELINKKKGPIRVKPKKNKGVPW